MTEAHIFVAVLAGLHIVGKKKPFMDSVYGDKNMSQNQPDSLI
jgi:hypothetical protein